MRKLFNSAIYILFVIFIFVFLTESALAQDATKVDSTHYKVEFENDQVRVVRISYGPGEKSVMHEHSEGVVVILNDQHFKFTFPDGKTKDIIAKAGQTLWFPGVKHLPENMSDKPAGAIFVEMKAKPETKEN